MLLPIHQSIFEGYIETPTIFIKNRYEIDSSMDRIFDGAERVRAKKHKKRRSVISSGKMTHMWDEQKRSFQAA